MAKIFKDRSYPRVMRKTSDQTPREFVEKGEVKGRDYRFQSGKSVFRRADPDNVDTADKQINMVTDYEKNMKIVPNGFVRGLGSSDKDLGLRGMNADGKSAHALPNITVGSGEDDKGVI